MRFLKVIPFVAIPVLAAGCAQADEEVAGADSNVEASVSAEIKAKAAVGAVGGLPERRGPGERGS